MRALVHRASRAAGIFSLLSPESLIRKLAGLVQPAATGGDADGQHAFYTGSSCPARTAHRSVTGLPCTANTYRPQREEPFVSNERMRIICGLSGAGKTAWAAQAAQHSTRVCVLRCWRPSSPALCQYVVRELAARFATPGARWPAKNTAPGASGG